MVVLKNNKFKIPAVAVFKMVTFAVIQIKVSLKTLAVFVILGGNSNLKLELVWSITSPAIFV